ncbi:MAG: hypothetical protein ACR2NN_20715 [Bryobacteraceae bacterium]
MRILRVYGDFLIWARGHVPDGTYAGARLSIHTSAPAVPVFTPSDLAVDNCFLYIQLATGGKPERAGFDNAVSTGGLLGKEKHALR